MIHLIYYFVIFTIKIMKEFLHKQMEKLSQYLAIVVYLINGF